MTIRSHKEVFLTALKFWVLIYVQVPVVFSFLKFIKLFTDDFLVIMHVILQKN